MQTMSSFVPEHMRHIPQPWKPGSVYPYQTGYAYSIVGACGNEYHIRTLTFASKDNAKQMMRFYTWDALAYQNEYGSVKAP